MSVGGWVMMTLSWSLILTMTVFSMSRVLRLKDDQARGVKPIEEIDTGDL